MNIGLNPYIHFNGNCEEAFNFYAQLFGGKIDGLHTFGGSPMAGQVPPEMAKKVMHATLVVQGQCLMGSDAPPGRYVKPAGFSISLNFTSAAEADRIFKELANSGQIVMEIQKTFWAERFGMCVDRFGIPWMINCHQAQ